MHRCSHFTIECQFSACAAELSAGLVHEMACVMRILRVWCASVCQPAGLGFWLAIGLMRLIRLVSRDW